tara:strand:- start:6499 stop:7329 length:831 start_codon:yes stop_codon:yes gene_type:complete
MQIGIISSKIKKSKKTFSNYSIIFFIFLSVFFIVLYKQNLISSKLISSKILNSVLYTKDFFSSFVPKISQIKENFKSKADLIEKNQYLEEQIEQSNLFKLKSQKLEIENNILRKELSLLPPIEDNYIFVKVIEDIQSLYSKTIIINAGDNMNIKVGDAAFTSKGLIGSVIEVYEKFSRILLISDINSKIPVRIGENNVKAIITGNNTNKIKLLYMKNNIDIFDGDIVYTSGDGGYFNPGIPVGVLIKNNLNEFVKPLNNLDQIQYVNIYINQFKNF